MDALQAAAVAAVFVLAGAVKGVTGMGLPTVAVSLLGLWMLPAQAAALLVAPTLVTNIFQSIGPQWRRVAAMLWPAWLGLVVFTIWTPDLARSAASVDPRAPLGAVLVVYGLLGLWRPLLPALPQRASWTGAAAGALTGIITAATAVFAIPLVPWLQALRLDKDAMVQALGLSFLVATAALAVRLQSTGDLALFSAPSALALGAALVGLRLGGAVRARIGAATFQRALFLVFIALGAANLLRGV